MKPFVPVVLALAFLVTCTARTVGSGRFCVPFKLVGASGKLVVVQVKLDGKGPYPMAVDTGSTSMLLSVTVAHNLHLHDIPAIVHAGGVGGTSGLTQVAAVRLRSVRVGGAERDGLIVAVTDISRFNRVLPTHIDGLLGYNFLEPYRVTIDYPKKRLCLAS